MGWHTIRKYLDAPAQGPAQRTRTSKLDPFKITIADWLEKDATVTGTVIEQRLRPLGYTGGPTILRDYLQKARPQSKPTRAFVRMEPTPGERFEVDWGHFGALDYSGDKRKLYAFALVEAHSRILYLEFTHSQSFETFVRCHIHAFAALGGVAREIAYDNLATAVAEHDGRLVRFLSPFLGFAREYVFAQRGVMDRACELMAAVFLFVGCAPVRLCLAETPNRVFRVWAMAFRRQLVLYKVDPEYTEEAFKAKYSGTVVLRTIVDSTGRARDICVVRSLGLGLDEEAIKAVNKWKFRPGYRNSRLVAVMADY
jgi:TonB family protein